MSATLSCEWWFYHLSETTPERAVGPLLEKCLANGWRVLAISPDVKRRSALDEVLWTYSEHSFLPHGQDEAEGLIAADQPILISARPDNQNQAEVALLMDGADIPAEADFTRCMVMFDEGDQTTREIARGQYKRARQAGAVARYFQQKGRKWHEIKS